MRPRIAATAVLLALAPLVLAQPQPAPGASIGTETVRPVPPIDPASFPTFSAAGIGSQKLEPEGCVIKPVMSDAELKRCGALPPAYPPRKLVTDMIK